MDEIIKEFNQFQNINIKDLLKNKKQAIKIFIIILILLLTILYVIPDIFALFLNTVLGNAILLLVAIYLFFYKDYRITIIFVLGWIIMVRIIQMAKWQQHKQENFENDNRNINTNQNTEGWTPDKIREFTALQYTMNPNYVFDTAQIAKVTTPQELDYFLANQQWPWSKEVEELYKTNLNHNTYVSNFSGEGLNRAKQLYSQNQILQILSKQSKEGQFLLNGVFITNQKEDNLPTDNGIGEYAYTSGIKSRSNERTTIKCGLDKNGNSVPQKIEGEYGTIENITDFNKLEEMIPGFTFLEESCNPCSALNDPPDYSCKYQLNIKDNTTDNSSIKLKNESAFPLTGISKIWSYIWNVPQTQTQNNTYHIESKGIGTISVL